MGETEPTEREVAALRQRGEEHAATEVHRAMLAGSTVPFHHGYIPPAPFVHTTMQLSHLLGVGLTLASLGYLFSGRDGAGASATETPSGPAAAKGHYVFVVEGDRDHLTITHANQKQDPWAGVPTGFTSDWSLSIRDGLGQELANVPLDLSKFDLSPQAQGQARRSEGCIVIDARVAMLANVPCYEDAFRYTFLHGKTEHGSVDAATVRQLAGGGR